MSLVPAWVKVLCPNATKLDLHFSDLAPHPLPQHRPHPHLQHLTWGQWWYLDAPMVEHVRQQLAALPSLTSLSIWDLGWAGGAEEDEQQAGRLISGTVTRSSIARKGWTTWPARCCSGCPRSSPT